MEVSGSRLKRNGPHPLDITVEKCGLLLALAFPDRIAGRKGGGYPCEAAGERPLRLDDPWPTNRISSPSSWTIRAPTAGFCWLHRSHRRMCASISGSISKMSRWWRGIQKPGDASARVREKLGAILLKDEPLSEPDPGEVLSALLDGIRQEGLDLCPASNVSRRLRQRWPLCTDWIRRGPMCLTRG